MADNEKDGAEPITIKKYANRRLYNTATSSYVTLEHLARMVKDGVEFQVFDAKSGEDITRQVLTHIIVEEEGKGQNMLPISFLRHLISFYGDNLQNLVPGYLDQSMKAFAKNQEQMRDYMETVFGGMNPFGNMEDIGKQNMALFENAMKMFTPEAMTGAMKAGMTGGGDAPDDDADDTQEMKDLREQMKRMQKRLDELESGD